MILDTISDGDTGNLVHGWFSDTAEGNPHTSGGDISRDRTQARVRDRRERQTLTLYGVPTFPTRVQGRRRPGQHALRAIVLPLQRPGRRRSRRRRSRPTAAASRGPRATASRSSTVPSFAGGCTTDGASPNAAMLIPGGKQPDWGPADVPSGRGAPAAAASRSSPRTRSSQGARPRASPCACACRRAGRLSATATRSGRKVAAGSKSVHGGTRTVEAPLHRRPRSARSSTPSSVKLRIKVAFKPRSGATQRTTVALTLKRSGESTMRRVGGRNIALPAASSQSDALHEGHRKSPPPRARHRRSVHQRARADTN